MIGRRLWREGRSLKGRNEMAVRMSVDGRPKQREDVPLGGGRP
jgi:hypothetical protein